MAFSNGAGRHLVTALGCALLLAGCESARFGGGRGPALAAARPAPAAVPPEPVVSAVPSGSVVAEPLAPPPGAAGAPGAGPVVADVPVMPGSPGPIEAIGAPAASPTTPAAPTRTALVGSWTAREAAGSGCRVSLSSTPSLDLYRASAAACASTDLGRVTAWDFRDGEVYLFQSGGAVAARLRPSGGVLAGVLAKSGAPITLTR